MQYLTAVWVLSWRRKGTINAIDKTKTNKNKQKQKLLNTNVRLKYCICTKFTELVAVLWLCTRIPLYLGKFTVKYLGVKSYDVCNLPLNALGNGQGRGREIK